MPRYIDADKILKFPIRADHCDKENADPHFINGIETVMEYVEYLVDEEPVDAAEVVRCKDCKYYCPESEKKGQCGLLGSCQPNEFCSRGRSRITREKKPRIEIGKYYRCVDEMQPCDGIIKISGKDGKRYSYDIAEGMERDFSKHFFYEGSLFESFLTPVDYKPRYYSGKVVCTYKDEDTDGYTVGKIYEFVNGTVVDDGGDRRFQCNPVSDISTLQFVTFIPLVE